MRAKRIEIREGFLLSANTGHGHWKNIMLLEYDIPTDARLEHFQSPTFGGVVVYVYHESFPLVKEGELPPLMEKKQALPPYAPTIHAAPTMTEAKKK